MMNFFQNMKISNKLILAFSVMVLLLATTGLFGYTSARHIQEDLDRTSSTA